MGSARNVVLLGATGSIGESTLRVIRKHQDRLKLIGISAHQQGEKLCQIAHEFGVKNVHLGHEQDIREDLPAETNFSTGSDGLNELAALEQADLVVVAVVGAAGLAPTLAALEAGKDVVLANKESLVVGGELVMETARRTGAKILPADSEHNGVFQCLHGQPEKSLDSIILTASGGPFRDFSLEQLSSVTPEQALKHPNWSMGPKITVDSATMANKGLELIEAHWLFGLPAERLKVVIHPPSLVHAIVQFKDGCTLAQMSPPSMTFALQNALLFPDRMEGVEQGLDFSQPLELSFSPPSPDKYPCLKLAQDCLAKGGTAPLVFNAANEVAVAAFLRNQIGFTEISDIIENTLNTADFPHASSLENLLTFDQEIRLQASAILQKLA
ncbi:MAG: 1-deoxy-D-xylulose-5-phosphate reductoisomerase [Opitutales bacterium]